jgi:YfiH family protein
MLAFQEGLVQRKIQNGIEWLEFDLFSDIPHLKHAVFLKRGGSSEGPFSSLNLSYGVGDNEQNVSKNIRGISKILDLELNPTCWGKQVHGAKIEQVNRESQNKILECDGFTTNIPNKALAIKHADCQAAIFYDPIHNAVSAIHAGWRGQVQNIYAEAIRTMQKLYGSQPQELLIGISPSLGPNAAEFINYRTEFPEYFWEYQVRPNYFNLWEISRVQLENCGVLPHHIEIAELCTYTHSEDYFSYRRDKITGRQATIVSLS